MTTAAPQGTGVAPAAPVTPAPEVAPVVPAPAPAEGAEIKLSSAELARRLEETREAARRAVYKKYGVEKAEDLDGRMAELEKLRNEKLSEAERTQKALNELGEKAKQGEQHGATAQAAIDLLFATLTPEQRAVIDAQAPATPAARLQMIQLARAFAGAAPPPAPAAPAAPPAPTTTTPPIVAPRPGGQKTPFEIWSELPATSIRAAAYYQANAAAIEASRPTPR